MDVRVVRGGFESCLGEAAVCLLTEQAALPEALATALLGLPAKADRKASKVTVLPTYGRLPVEHVLLVGMGDGAKLTSSVLRQAVGQAANALRELGARSASAVVWGAEELAPCEAGAALAEGLVLSGYRFVEYCADPGPAHSLAQVTLFVAEGEAAWSSSVAQGVVKGELTAVARDLVNTPSNHLMPADLVRRIASLAECYGLGLRVVDEAELVAMGAGLILAVNAGSAAPAAMVVLEHRGGPVDETPLGLVGKGVCYDSGGLSLKPSESMARMKGDMAGAAAVIGAMCAAAQLGVRRNVTAVLPLVANLVGPASLRPSDVVTALDGRHVEVLNTDAEGRLILADALTYATRDLGLSPVVDIATLSGACARALGPVFAGVFGADEALVRRLRDAGEAAGERFWPLPLDEGYADLLKSSVADIKNVAGSPSGGASAAAMFLASFVGDTPWLHLDIAGMALTDTEGPCQPKGATGMGVRTLVNLMMSECCHR
ncbi:MAG: leucyl aminopeptidase [Armatimonadetes bacterium]|nr:leucyl aminopeptidase [Armatimonadota bacterium]